MKVLRNGLRISLKSYDHRLLDSLASKIRDLAIANQVPVSSIPLPTRRCIFTLPRSPFIYKDSADQFIHEVKTRVVFLGMQGGVELLKTLNIPAGVEVAINVRNSKNQKVS